MNSRTRAAHDQITPLSAAEFDELVDALTTGHAAGSAAERRTSIRRQLVTDVTIQPLDESWQAFGEPILGLTTDISTGGIGFVTRQEIRSALMQLTFDTPTGQRVVLAEHVRTRKVGGLCQIGVRFVRTN
jgi:hypothetical protein